MKSVLKWTVIGVSTGAAALLAYRWAAALRARLDRGLERVEHVADDARRAVAHTEEALGQTAETVHGIRRAIR